jgi:hypothetical protein
MQRKNAAFIGIDFENQSVQEMERRQREDCENKHL